MFSYSTLYLDVACQKELDINWTVATLHYLSLCIRQQTHTKKIYQLAAGKFIVSFLCFLQKHESNDSLSDILKVNVRSIMHNILSTCFFHVDHLPDYANAVKFDTNAAQKSLASCPIQLFESLNSSFSNETTRLATFLSIPILFKIYLDSEKQLAEKHAIVNATLVQHRQFCVFRSLSQGIIHALSMPGLKKDEESMHAAMIAINDMLQMIHTRQLYHMTQESLAKEQFSYFQTLFLRSLQSLLENRMTTAYQQFMCDSLLNIHALVLLDYHFVDQHFDSLFLLLFDVRFIYKFLFLFFFSFFFFFFLYFFFFFFSSPKSHTNSLLAISMIHYVPLCACY